MTTNYEMLRWGILGCGGATEDINLPDPPHVHQPFIERVVAHILDDAPKPCDGRSGMRANEILTRIFAGL